MYLLTYFLFANLLLFIIYTLFIINLITITWYLYSYFRWDPCGISDPRLKMCPKRKTRDLSIVTIATESGPSSLEQGLPHRYRRKRLLSTISVKRHWSRVSPVTTRVATPPSPLRQPLPILITSRQHGRNWICLPAVRDRDKMAVVAPRPLSMLWTGRARSWRQISRDATQYPPRRPAAVRRRCKADGPVPPRRWFHGVISR